MGLFNKKDEKAKATEKKLPAQARKSADKRTQMQKIQDQQKAKEQAQVRDESEEEGNENKAKKVMQRFVTGDQASFKSSLTLRDGLSHDIVCKKGIIETADQVLADHLRTMYRNA